MRVEVFVSYDRQDRSIVQEIIKYLEENDIITWWDDKITATSSDYSNEISSAIVASQCFIVVWTANSVDSQWVRGEVSTAVSSSTERPKVIHLSVGNPEIPMEYRTCQVTPVITSNEKIDEKSLSKIHEFIKKVIGIQGPKEHLVIPKLTGEAWTFHDLAIESTVPGLDLFVSFRPCDSSGVFLLTRYQTTPGWVNVDILDEDSRHASREDGAPTTYDDPQYGTFNKVKNDIFLIMDPVRPFSIQIGELRSKRPSASPGIISGDIEFEQLRMLPLSREWLCMTLAEILSKKESLQYLWNRVETYNEDCLPGQEWEEELVKKIKQTIGKNPNAPINLQREYCPFCNDIFKKYRALNYLNNQKPYGVYLIANDFPFGPHFHLMAITSKLVHSWEELTYLQLRGLNFVVIEFLQDEKNLNGAAGIAFGFNSTIRHLVLGEKTRSSAGASIPHIHKQAWGLVPNASNISEHLIKICEAYWNNKIDYLERYLNALDEAGYVLWKDDNIALYVPYGQCSKHELQAMVLRPRGCVTELNGGEIASLSKAEYIALRLFQYLGIKSFNHVILTKLFHDARAPRFRLVEAFITREVDFAVSELSMLFVVDQHPWDSCKEIRSIWNNIKIDVLAEFERAEDSLSGC